MASFAPVSRGASRSAAVAPISAHPAFPAVVALWFAALLGLGSLVMPLVLMERLVTVTGLASLMPIAGPPLGFTARATIALGAAILGAILGLALARQVARNQSPGERPRFVAGDSRQCRPISAHDELGEEGLDSPELAGFGKKRRSLALAEDGRKSEILRQYAPLPGQQSGDHLYKDDVPDDALELGDFAEATNGGENDTGQDFEMTDRTNFGISDGTFGAPGERQEFVPFGDDQEFEDEDFEEVPVVSSEPVDALRFSPPSLHRQEFAANDEDDQEETDEDFDARDFGLTLAPVSQAFEPAPVASFAPPEAAPARRAESFASMADNGGEERPLESLGLVQLATRLGASLERRRAQRATHGLATPVRAPLFAADEEDFDSAAAEEAARARADFFAESQFELPQAIEPVAAPSVAFAPAPLEPLSFDADGDFADDDFAASFSLPLKSKRAVPHLPEATAEPGDEDEGFEEDEAEEADGDYSSLLAIKNPFQKADDFVRIDEPEPDEDDDFEATVTFPPRIQSAAPAARAFDPPANGQQGTAKGSTADLADADKELRAALATLQRMSGSV